VAANGKHLREDSPAVHSTVPAGQPPMPTTTSSTSVASSSAPGKLAISAVSIITSCGFSPAELQRAAAAAAADARIVASSSDRVQSAKGIDPSATSEVEHASKKRRVEVATTSDSQGGNSSSMVGEAGNGVDKAGEKVGREGGEAAKDASKDGDREGGNAGTVASNVA